MSAGEFGFDVPLGPDTSTSVTTGPPLFTTEPVRSGAVTLIELSVTDDGVLVATTLPLTRKSTAVAPVNPEPETVSGTLPAMGPSTGDTPVTCNPAAAVTDAIAGLPGVVEAPTATQSEAGLQASEAIGLIAADEAFARRPW